MSRVLSVDCPFADFETFDVRRKSNELIDIFVYLLRNLTRMNEAGMNSHGTGLRRPPSGVYCERNWYRVMQYIGRQAVHCCRPIDVSIICHSGRLRYVTLDNETVVIYYDVSNDCMNDVSGYPLTQRRFMALYS